MYWSRWMYCLVVCGSIAVAGCQPKPAYQPPPPPRVKVVKPTVKTIPVFLEENGQTEAVEQAVVEARVRGILQEIKVAPDKIVSEGELLFEIEKEEYLAAVKSAEASLGSAKAALTSAQAQIGVCNAEIKAANAAIEVTGAETKRMKGLLDSKAVALNEYEAALAALKTSNASLDKAVAAKGAAEADVINAQAQVDKADADLTQARLDLEWTDVKAPISGRVTRTLVKRGNLVENGTPLVEIVKNDPIWVNFNINERFLLSMEKNRSKSGDPEGGDKIPVRLQRMGDVGFPFEGYLDYFDPKVDQNLGTMQLRAIIENKPGGDKILLPGLFVMVQIQIGEQENAMLIPERAIGRDQTGAFVFVVDSEKKAMRKNVSLGTKHEGMIAIVDGIDSTDLVIIDGIQRVRPGAEVEATEAAGPD